MNDVSRSLVALNTRASFDGSWRKPMTRLFFCAVALAGLIATPAFAQVGGVVIVMHYETPDGSVKTLPAPTPGKIMSMEECRAVGPRQVPILKRQLGNTKNFPEFTGWKFLHATCEIYSDDLLSTVE